MGTFFFDIWLFLPKCLKNTVKQVSPPLIFHSLWSINDAPVSPAWRKARWVQRRQCPGCSVGTAGGQVVKGRLGHMCPWCQSGFSLLQGHRVCTVLTELWVMSSRLQCRKGELGWWVGGYELCLMSSLISDPHPPLSAYSLALVAVGWALTLSRSANPALSCSRQHKSAVLLQGPWKLL